MRTAIRRLVPALMLAALAALVAACDETTPTEPTPTTTTTATTVTVTESFSAALAVSGSNTHTFNAQPGPVAVTITAEAPDSTLSLGLDVGQWDAKNEACTTVLTSNAAVVGTVLIGTATTAIELCIRVYDVGTLTSENSPVTYTVVTEHQALSS